MDIPMLGWVNNQNKRGTLDIIWSCVFVVFLSTYTTLHNNVPPVGKSAWWKLKERSKLMLVGLLAPEYVATIAFTELRSALIVRSHMRRLGYEQWTLAQSFFVAMGGYMIQVNQTYKPISAENFITWQRRGLIRLLSSVDAVFGGPRTRSGDDNGMELMPIPSPPVKAKPLHSFGSATELPWVLEPLDSRGSAVELPWILDKDISSRGKVDVFLKGIACAQIAWLLVQYCARRAQWLATSSLEALTVAYVVCALFSYAAWWKKPYDLETPICTQVSPEHEIAKLLEDAPDQIPVNDDPDLPVLDSMSLIFLSPCIVACLAYSGLHFLAWDAHFVTLTEAWLWRASAILFVWFHVVFIAFAAHMEKNWKKSPTAANIANMGNCAELKAVWCIFHGIRILTFGDRSARLNRIDEMLLSKCDPELTPSAPMVIFFVTHTFFYFAGRFYVMIEAFAGLRQQPADLYDNVNWVAFIPHMH